MLSGNGRAVHAVRAVRALGGAWRPEPFPQCARMSIARMAARQGSAAVVAASLPLLPRAASLPHRRPPQQPPAHAQQSLRCSARLTSSRDNLDEEHLEQQQQQPQQQAQQQPKRQAARNGRPRAAAAAPAGLEQQAQAQPSGLAEQQELLLQQAEQQAERVMAQRQRVQQEAAIDQQLAAGRAPGQSSQAPPHQLTIAQLQQLTDLHVEDSFKLGVVDSAAELAECLGTDLRDGLRDGQAELAARAERYGANVTRPPKEVTFLQLVLEALQDFTILILIGAGSLSLVLEFAVNQHTSGEGSWIEGASILAAVCVVVLVTAVNNYQKEQQFRMLQAVSSDVKVRGIRNGREQALPVKDVLVGDLLLVEAGDILVADGLLVAGTDVKVDESHLTGEADDIAKDPCTRPPLLGGSKILSGFGRMLVTSVGAYSQSGMIAEMVADGKPSSAALTPDGRPAPAAADGIADGLREETLLQRKLAEYATSIGRFGLGAASLAFAAMTVRFSYTTFVVEGSAWDWAFLQDYLRFFITGVTILVVAVPEGLPLAVTLALAFSVRRMLADQNLVRHLSAAETMGTANVVCSDKTGTLTQNDMVVSKLWLAGHLLPDLLPYTRRANTGTEEQHGLAQQALAKSKQKQAGAGSGSTGSTRGTTRGTAGDGFSSASSASGLPPLADVVRDSCSSATSTAGSTEGSGVWESRSSMLESVTAGAAPADVLQLLVESVALNSTANIFSGEDGKEKRIGNRTEVALLDLARLLGAKPKTLRRQQRQIAQVPFSSERKRMTTVSLPPGYDPDGDTHLCRIYTKGASEIVLEKCSYVLTPDGTRRRLRSEEKEQLMAGFCEGAQRVLCLAYRDVTMPADSLVPASAARTTSTGSDSDSSSSAASGSETSGTSNGADTSALGNGNLAGMGGEWVWDAGSFNTAMNSSEEEAAAPWDESLTLADNLESNLTLLAMVGIEDPLREEVPAAILQCQASGITVKMLTGDNVATATAIARDCGILPPPGTAWLEWPPGHSTAAAATASGNGWYSGSQDSSGNLLEAGGNLGSGGGNLGATLDSANRPAGSVVAARNGSGSSGGSAGTTTAVHGCVHEVEVEVMNDELPDGVVMEGPEFRRRVLRDDGSINKEAFLELWPKLRVLARCSPTDKYTIVTGVRSLTKDVVAVTGDGTNDAPALRAANIGFAMNAGTDTAKEAADIVLLDNNFASIVSAVLWGRNVYANITRFLQFQLTINLVAVATAVTGAVVASESPLTAVQMLWVNLIMDSLASLALATEPPDTRMLAIPPFSQEHEFVDPRTPTVKHIIGQATYQLAVLAGLIFYAPALLGIPDHNQVVGPSVHYTLVFNTFVFMQLFNQLNARKVLDSSVAWDGLGNAKWFQWILGSELVLQILIVQFGGSWFNTAPLDSKEWAVCVGLGATTLGLREILRRLPYGRWWFALK